MAARNAAPLPPTAAHPPDAPKGCLFVSEWGKARADKPESNLSRKVTSFWNMAAEIGGRGGKGGMVHGVRSLGSATLDCVYVATGAADIFWEGGCVPGFDFHLLMFAPREGPVAVLGN